MPQRDLGCFDAGAVAPKPALFGGTYPTPLKMVFSTLSIKLQTFYTITFFSDSPEGFALFLGQCAALRSLAQLTTPFLASGKAPKWVFFHLIDKIADFLHNKLFCLIAPRDLHYYWASAQPCAVNNTFFSLLGMPQNGVFALRIAHIAPSLFFCTKGIFFGWSQRD